MVKQIPDGYKYLYYLCQCNDKKNPYKYKGSGTKWLNILKTYKSTKIITLVLGHYDTVQEIRHYGSLYSKQFDVQNSSEWANLVPEYGPGRAVKYINIHTNEIRYFHESDVVPEDYKKFLRRDIGPTKGKKVFNNGYKNIFLGIEEEIPQGFKPGLLREYDNKGKLRYYNIETGEVRYIKNKSDVPENFIPGKPKKYDPNKNTDEKIILSDLKGKEIIFNNVRYRSRERAAKEENMSVYHLNNLILTVGVHFIDNGDTIVLNYKDKE